MKNYLYGILATALLAFTACTKEELSAPEPAPAPDVPAEYRSGEVLVKFAPYVSDILDREGITRSGGPATRSGILSVDEILDIVGGYEIERVFPVDPRNEERTRESELHLWYVVRFGEEYTAAEVAERFSALGEVQHVSVNRTIHRAYNAGKKAAPLSRKTLEAIQQQRATRTGEASAYPFDDVLLPQQWHLVNRGNMFGGKSIVDADVQCEQAWELSTGDESIVVAVLDEGVMIEHPDLKNNMWVNENEIYRSHKDNDGNGYQGDVYGYNLVLFTPAILQACAVPREIFAITAIYLRITFLGAPFTCFYNALAAGFKSVGDARTPLRFLMVSAILNAALDLIFIGGLGFGIVCSAMTTVIAEAFSAVLAGWWLWTKTPELCPRRGQWRVDRSLLGRTLQYGGVSALQQAVQPIGKVLIQGQVNALGVEVIAAFNAVTRIDDFACIPEQSIAQGITTYIAQNRGAGRQDRIRRGFAVGLGMEAAYWMLIGGVVTLFKTPLAAMFVTGEGADRVIALAVQYLGTMALFYLLPAMTNGFQGYYRGMGNMPMTLLGTLIQTSLRVVTTCILAPRMGMYGIAFACATGWCVMLMVEVPFYFWQKARNE